MLPSTKSSSPPPKKIVIVQGNIVTPKGVLFGGFIEIHEDTIVAVEPSTTPIPSQGTPLHEDDNVEVELVSSPWVIPGFVDIHNHGLGGCDEVCDHWLFPEFTQRKLAQCGTLSTLASVIFSSTRQYAVNAVLRSIESRVGHAFPNCAVIEGIHAEGPVIQDRGGLPPVEAQLTLPKFQALCGRMPSMKIMTISPSQEVNSSLPTPTPPASSLTTTKVASPSSSSLPKKSGGFDRMQHLVNLGVRLSLGHDRTCQEEEILSALALRPTMAVIDAWKESLKQLTKEEEEKKSGGDGVEQKDQKKEEEIMMNNRNKQLYQKPQLSVANNKSGLFSYSPIVAASSSLLPADKAKNTTCGAAAHDPPSTKARIMMIERTTPKPTDKLRKLIATLHDASPKSSSSSSTSSIIDVEDSGSTRCHSTHIFNVMSNHHRNPSLGNLLMCKQFPAVGRGAGGVGNRYKGLRVPTVELIGDLIHVHPLVVQSLLSARDPQADIAMISDCISSYDPGKRLKYNGRTIAVKAEGGCYLCDSQGKPSPTLAGSTVNLADQFYVLMTHFHQDVTNACLMLATTPARIAHIGNRVGSLEVGKKANILLLNGEMNTIVRSAIYGRWVDAAPYRMLKPSHL